MTEDEIKLHKLAITLDLEFQHETASAIRAFLSDNERMKKELWRLYNEYVKIRAESFETPAWKTRAEQAEQRLKELSEELEELKVAPRLDKLFRDRIK